ncbi:hypothetical protein ACHMW6_06320 [Pseudoduganella sp. UC29_106]|uniref:hypothetical protein n=1 Tax=Pseudoduganella sp. UC29_106 TaxID=3374553 RepID=UPI0037581CEF
MKKTVKMIINRREEVLMEVEFPIYSQHDLTDHYPCVYYRRHDADGRRMTIHYSDHGRGPSYELKVERNVALEASDPDYPLGRGQFACTAEEFNNILRDAVELAESMK